MSIAKEYTDNYGPQYYSMVAFQSVIDPVLFALWYCRRWSGLKPGKEPTNVQRVMNLVFKSIEWIDDDDEKSNSDTDI